jgi:hypothetical protein
MINAVFFESNSKEVGQYVSFDNEGKLMCTIYSKKPHRAVTIQACPLNITTSKEEGEEELLSIAVLCEDHFQRLQRQDVELVAARANTAKQRKSGQKNPDFE